MGKILQKAEKFTQVECSRWREMQKELESTHRCLATEPHELVYFPRLILKGVERFLRWREKL